MWTHQVLDLSFAQRPPYKTVRRKISARIQRLLAEALAQKYLPGTGKSSITYASRAFPKTHDADDFFNRLVPELFRVREWKNKTTLTSFELFDEKGDISERQTALVGDFIRLSVLSSGRSDWVKVIEIIDEPDEAILTIEPSHDPTQNEPDNITSSHFFTSDSTNSFCLEKTNAIVSFYVIGLSTKTNRNKAGSFIEKARSVAVSKVGPYFGVQKGDWKTFCANFLRLTDQGNPGRRPASPQETMSVVKSTEFVTYPSF